MARPLRIQYENAYYHVTCRGNARQDICDTDRDRSTFLDLLERSSDIYQVDILVYVLMANHFHLLVKTPHANLQEFMRHFSITYPSHYNRRHLRMGHLFQGRYKSFLIDADQYLQEVSRYIHLNPVRVSGFKRLGLEERKRSLERYLWSSYSGYIFPRLRRPFLRGGEVLDYFGGDTARGRKRYEGFVRDGLAKEVRSPLEIGKGHGMVGGAGFVEGIRRRFIRDSGKQREVPAVRRVLGQVGPEKIIGLVSKEMGFGRQELLGRGGQGLWKESFDGALVSAWGDE
jgi:putative transposase